MSILHAMRMVPSWCCVVGPRGITNRGIWSARWPQRKRPVACIKSAFTSRPFSQTRKVEASIIGKYLSRLRKLHQVIAPKEGFEAQLRAARLPITFGMSALGMTRQIRDGRLHRVIEPCHVPGLQGLDNPA